MARSRYANNQQHYHSDGVDFWCVAVTQPSSTEFSIEYDISALNTTINFAYISVFINLK